MDRKDVVIYIYFNILHILIYIWKRENHMDEMYIEMCNVCYIYIYIYIYGKEMTIWMKCTVWGIEA